MSDAAAKRRGAYSARAARLLALSEQCLADARSPALSSTGAVGAAFDAGYLALLSVLSDEEANSGVDHPDLDLLRTACERAGLSGTDRVMALRFAEAYYQGGRRQFDPRECHDWASRARSAVQRAFRASLLRDRTGSRCAASFRQR